VGRTPARRCGRRDRPAAAPLRRRPGHEGRDTADHTATGPAVAVVMRGRDGGWCDPGPAHPDAGRAGRCHADRRGPADPARLGGFGIELADADVAEPAAVAIGHGSPSGRRRDGTGPAARETAMEVCLALVAEQSLCDCAEKKPTTGRRRRRAGAVVRYPESLRGRRLRRQALQLQPQSPLLDPPRLGSGAATAASASLAPPEAQLRQRSLREPAVAGPRLPLVAFVLVRAASSIGRAVPS
jgi:hypothetical protein